MQAISLFLGFTAALAHASPVARAPVSCAEVQPPTIANATILSTERTEYHNLTVSAYPPLLPFAIPDLNVCEVKVTYTHPGANDSVVVLVWLPLSGWNGRFSAVGGSAWAAGFGNVGLAPVVAQGYAAAVTDAGLPLNPYSPEAWALNAAGNVNIDFLINFASRSVHEVAVVGKAVTASFYGKPAQYAYWQGCSTGGRQGLVAAQQYPEDFDGILAGAPASNWTGYVIGELWPQVVMKEAGVFPSSCELDAVVQAAVTACDELDGVKDNIITSLDKCSFDPLSVVGSTVLCDGTTTTITKEVAEIVRKVWEGPKTSCGTTYWPGLTIGAPLDNLTATVDINGSRAGVPFFVADTWTKYFVKADPNFDTSSLDSASLFQTFTESQSKFGSIIDSDSPDLSGLQKSGGKLLVWHGLADQLIFPQDTIAYRQKVEATLGLKGTDVDDFFRVFLAPGVDHCAGGLTFGAAPSNPFQDLVDWVERGRTPRSIRAQTLPNAPVQFTRKICKYPLVAKYNGKGDQSKEESYTCLQED